MSSHIGHWRNGKQQGYGRLTVDGGEANEGIFEEGNLNPSKKGYRSFDPSEELLHETLKKGQFYASK